MDLDDDELRATREMNGAAKNDDLKILEEIKQSIDTDYGTGKRKVQAIENLINRIKELEEDYTSVYLKGIYDERDKWKSKIKEKIFKLSVSDGLEDNIAIPYLKELLKGE